MTQKHMTFGTDLEGPEQSTLVQVETLHVARLVGGVGHPYVVQLLETGSRHTAVEWDSTKQGASFRQTPFQANVYSNNNNSGND